MPNSMYALNARRADHGDDVKRHLLDRHGCCTARRADSPVVDGDDAMPAGKAIDDPRVEVVQDRTPMVEQDQRHSAAWANFAIGEGSSSDVDGAVRRMDVRRARYTVRTSERVIVDSLGPVRRGDVVSMSQGMTAR